MTVRGRSRGRPAQCLSRASPLCSHLHSLSLSLSANQMLHENAGSLDLWPVPTGILPLLQIRIKTLLLDLPFWMGSRPPDVMLLDAPPLTWLPAAAAAAAVDDLDAAACC